jgi:hypothetical protein
LPSDKPGATVTGRCYCGATTLVASDLPKFVTYCHCSDCKRWTGAPLPAFAGFADGDVEFKPSRGPTVSFAPGVDRWFCRACGSPLAARFDYLPGQIYVPLGLLDQINTLPPQAHAHHGARAPWLHVSDDAATDAGSARDRLNADFGGGDD